HVYTYYSSKRQCRDEHRAPSRTPLVPCPGPSYDRVTWCGMEGRMRLQDKVCIITGAGSGMGRVATRMFCEQGARVVAADVVQAAGEETVALAREAGQGEAVFVRADVSREEDCANLVHQTVRRYGRLDVIYNNAGIM